MRAMNNRKDIRDTGSGCFSSILRRLLCSGSVPTHPSNPSLATMEPKAVEFNQGNKIKDSDMVTEAKVEKPTQSPGIVAKLMGLDSLPAAAVDMRLGLNGSSPGLVTRSRSVNFMDYILKQKSDTTLTLPHHRRLKTSASLQEVHEKKSQQLFVLFLNDTDTMKNQGSQAKKSRYSFVKLKKDFRGKSKKSTRNKALEDQECRKVTEMKNVSRRVSSKGLKCNGDNDQSIAATRKMNFYQEGEAGVNASKSPLKTIEAKEVSAESKLMKKKKLHKKNQIPSRKTKQKGGSVTLSTASVFDVKDFMIQYETELSEYTNSIDLDSGTFTSLQYTKPLETDTKELRASRNGDREPKNNNDTRLYAELVDKLVKLTEEEFTKLNWVSTRMPIRFEDYEHFCIEVGQDILNVLLQQLVDELGIHATDMHEL